MPIGKTPTRAREYLIKYENLEKPICTHKFVIKKNTNEI
jgi:hypothetical protein